MGKFILFLSRKLVFSPSRSDLVVQSSRFFFQIPDREIYNLGMVSGPVLFRIKGESWVFIFLGFKKNKKQRNENEQIIDEICEMLVS